MKYTKHVRAALAELRRAGGTIISVQFTGSSHVRIQWSASGRRHLYVAGSSPSDRNVLRRIRADARRMTRELAP